MSEFTKGSIIVRNDRTYPAGALVVDDFHRNGNLIVHPLGGGLQLTLPRSEIDRFTCVEVEETVSIFTAGAFYIHGIDKEFNGWSDGSSWNGWEKPGFSRVVAEDVLSSLGCSWHYNPEADEFTVDTSQGEDEPERFTGETIHLGDGGSVTAYFVGAGSWVWDKI